MADGPSTPALAAAVSSAGGLGFLAAGYKSADKVHADIHAVRSATDRPFGVNVFAPPGSPADPDLVRRYAEQIDSDVRNVGADLGEPRHDDDQHDAKVALLMRERPAVLSFAFGCPSRSVVGDLRRAGTEVWVTVTDPSEAKQAVEAGADALVVQGVEAGGHRGGARRRSERRGAGRGLPALPRGRHVCPASPRTRRVSPDRPHTRILRPDRTRDAQPLAGGRLRVGTRPSARVRPRPIEDPRTYALPGGSARVWWIDQVLAHGL